MAKRPPREPRPGQPVPELLPEKPSLPAVRDDRAGLQGLRPLQARNADGVRRGTSQSRDHDGRRATGRRRGSCRSSICRTGGRLLDRALEEAGIDRSRVYVTNVVKHFKWEPRGKRRIHAKPNAAEIGACRPWLDTEIGLVKPRVLVCLGATAAQALLGRAFKVTQQRGTFVPSTLAPLVTATVHPSSILRAPDDESRRVEMREFVADLKKVTRAIAQQDPRRK